MGYVKDSDIKAAAILPDVVGEEENLPVDWDHVQQISIVLDSVPSRQTPGVFVPPDPVNTQTLQREYGFAGVRVRVALENPRVTRADLQQHLTPPLMP